MAARHATPCPCCNNLFVRHATHLASSARCKAFVDFLEAEDDDDLPELTPVDDDDIDEAYNLAEAKEVADGLATLKYERGFQRPDVDAAKAFAGTVGKRTSELAFGALQSLLRPGVQPAQVAAGKHCLPPPSLWSGSCTCSQSSTPPPPLPTTTTASIVLTW